MYVPTHIHMWHVRTCAALRVSVVPGDEVGGEEGKDSVHKSGDVQPPVAGTHDTAQGERPTTTTPFSPTAKQTAVEPTKLLKSPKR